jgi:acetyl esterase/lipase
MLLRILFTLCCSLLSAAEKQTYIYKTVGELKIEADVYCPPGSGRFPTILMFHGGALIMGDRNLNPKEVDPYLENGYAVLMVKKLTKHGNSLALVIDRPI